MHCKVNIILSGNRIRQHPLEIQIFIQFHQGQKHQVYRMFIDLRLIHRKRIHPAQTVRDTDINDLLTLLRHRRAFSFCILIEYFSFPGSVPAAGICITVISAAAGHETGHHHCR